LNARTVVVLLGLVLAASAWHLTHRPRHRAPGVLAPDVPEQRDIGGKTLQFERGGAQLTALASFALRARVLSREDYRFDAGAVISPVDLALGWGRMSDSAVLDKVSISQYGRFYHWYVDEFPIPNMEIIESSANMHLVPADGAVERAIDKSRAGDVIELQGYLVAARMPDGGEWRSSLTRSDAGYGACELVWVESFTISPP
jgi:hypothetical protein